MFISYLNRLLVALYAAPIAYSITSYHTIVIASITIYQCCQTLVSSWLTHTKSTGSQLRWNKNWKAAARHPLLVVTKADKLADCGWYEEASRCTGSCQTMVLSWKNPNSTSMKATQGGKLNVTNLSTEIKTILSLFQKDKKETTKHL